MKDDVSPYGCHHHYIGRCIMKNRVMKPKSKCVPYCSLTVLFHQNWVILKSLHILCKYHGRWQKNVSGSWMT